MSIISQLRGTVRNVITFDVELGDLLPPSFVSTLIWIRDTVPRGLGFANRSGHLTGVVALTLVMIVASLATLTFVAIGYFVVVFPIALLRFIPAVERRWPLTTDDWPLWTVQSEGFGA